MCVYYVYIHWSKKVIKSQATGVCVSGLLEGRDNAREK